MFDEYVEGSGITQDQHNAQCAAAIREEYDLTGDYSIVYRSEYCNGYANGDGSKCFIAMVDRPRTFGSIIQPELNDVFQAVSVLSRKFCLETVSFSTANDAFEVVLT